MLGFWGVDLGQNTLQGILLTQQVTEMKRNLKKDSADII